MAFENITKFEEQCIKKNFLQATFIDYFWPSKCSLIHICCLGGPASLRFVLDLYKNRFDQLTGAEVILLVCYVEWLNAGTLGSRHVISIFLRNDHVCSATCSKDLYEMVDMLLEKWRLLDYKTVLQVVTIDNTKEDIFKQILLEKTPIKLSLEDLNLSTHSAECIDWIARFCPQIKIVPFYSFESMNSMYCEYKNQRQLYQFSRNARVDTLKAVLDNFYEQVMEFYVYDERLLASAVSDVRMFRMLLEMHPETDLHGLVKTTIHSLDRIGDADVQKTKSFLRRHAPSLLLK